MINSVKLRTTYVQSLVEDNEDSNDEVQLPHNMQHSVPIFIANGLGVERGPHDPGMSLGVSPGSGSAPAPTTQTAVVETILSHETSPNESERSASRKLPATQSSGNYAQEQQALQKMVSLVSSVLHCS
jgi:hypothetical protein